MLAWFTDDSQQGHPQHPELQAKVAQLKREPAIGKVESVVLQAKRAEARAEFAIATFRAEQEQLEFRASLVEFKTSRLWRDFCENEPEVITLLRDKEHVRWAALAPHERERLHRYFTEIGVVREFAAVIKRRIERTRDDPEDQDFLIVFATDVMETVGRIDRAIEDGAREEAGRRGCVLS
ncbi:hypothetical protein LTR95_009550 [Oleoguttula sp. CCFEE 5521]